MNEINFLIDLKNNNKHFIINSFCLNSLKSIFNSLKNEKMYVRSIRIHGEILDFNLLAMNMIINTPDVCKSLAY